MRIAVGTTGLALALAGLLSGAAPARSLSVRGSGHAGALPATAAPAVTKIAFASDRDGNFEIYTMDADGGGLARLTENEAEDFSPAWSPDGTRLAFVSTRDGNQEIYVMNADGTGQTRLTHHAADDLSPAWSPDGTRIAFSSGRDGNDEIYTVSPGGGGLLNLTHSPGDDTQPAFSPDGSSIAFASNREFGQYEIYRMDDGGGGVVRLTSNGANDSNPNWSPGRITFQSDRDGDEDLYSMNADGSGQQHVTSNAAVQDVEPSAAAGGGRLAFASTRNGDFEIFLANADGSAPVRLTTNPASDVQPALQQLGVIPGPAASTLRFSSAVYSVGEGTAVATITITRAGNTAGAASVGYAARNGTATDKGDYAPAIGTLNFSPGQASRSFSVSIINDAFVEGDEFVNLTLRNPVGAALGPPATARLVIRDNDGALLSTNPNPIDDIEFFVRQQYLDFLGREPDPPGFRGWVDILRNCAFGDTRCDRVEVSSAFFRSAEFQGRGFFVYRIYETALGRVPRYAEFLPDLARVSGFQTDAQLEASKVAFINDFIMRPEFAARYDALSDAAYVNALVSTAGVTLPNKQALIDDLVAGRKTRAQVLRAVAESAQVAAKFFNKAFVVMEYFGYLHRDPDILYLKWLDLLNRTGDFRVMVNGFVNSLEYRSRFGPP